VYFPPELREYLPGITEFTYAEEYPEAIHLASPRYPELARKADLRASVIVRALIDVNGDVIDARIMGATTEGVGFEEAALDAAFKCKWTPALQRSYSSYIRGL
jgi:TonB family protein